MIRVLVVDDSIFMRKVLSDIINSDPELQVCGAAKNGRIALELIKELKPDVVTMDVEMPEVDGITALREIENIPVIMISSLTTSGADLTLKALEAGAFDFVSKPSRLTGMINSELKAELIEKIKESVKSRDRSTQFLEKPKPVRERVTATSRIAKIVAIGISTGGPKALHEMLPQFDMEFDGSILIVQHMPAGFTKTFAERLSTVCHLNVKEATDGEKIKPRTIYIAPGNRHMLIIKQNLDFVIKLEDTEKVGGHKPAADVMFDSLSKIEDAKVVGVIMTGMGSDGTKGLINLKTKNHLVIAQDEESSVVFGMPGSAIKAGVVDKVVSLDNLASEIMKAVEN